MKTDQKNQEKGKTTNEQNKTQQVKRVSRYIIERIFSRDGITQVYFFIIVSLMFNMGIGLYYCGRNMNNDYNIVSNIIFEAEKGVNRSENWYPKRMNILEKEPELNQKLEIMSIYGKESKNVAEKPAKEERNSGLVQPRLNLMPTCLYSKKFPEDLGINELLFWNASSDKYVYWSYNNKSNTFLILTHACQFSSISTENAVFSFIGRDQPIIASFKSHIKDAKEGEKAPPDKQIIAFGENNLPPYWYMNWRTPNKELFRPSFLPCLGSLFTFRDRDLVSFFETNNVIYACSFKAYAGSHAGSRSAFTKDARQTVTDDGYLELDNVPFVKIDKDYYTSFVSGSKNSLLRLHLNKCMYGTLREETWVISFSNGVSVSENTSFCEERSSWISFLQNPTLLSNGNTESGDWRSRIENDKFVLSKGQMKNTTCYENWWTTYGGVPSRQFVPSA
ncbi:hypothetical protein FG386_003699 [Cryptosporidium ryanae]|uniref:uncharacterized protein n=1 Tax=Cryptosporidium ryanae TaxID=515981 RepID=UPI00351A6B3C|nr:hypothetical protein FG386_003699 [Cryptosporidium ryanae]